MNLEARERKESTMAGVLSPKITGALKVPRTGLGFRVGRRPFGDRKFGNLLSAWDW